MDMLTLLSALDFNATVSLAVIIVFAMIMTLSLSYMAGYSRRKTALLTILAGFLAALAALGLVGLGVYLRS